MRKVFSVFTAFAVAASLAACGGSSASQTTAAATQAAASGETKAAETQAAAATDYPKEAITMKGNLPVIDYEKCVNCGLCAKKCPAKSIS